MTKEPEDQRKGVDSPPERSPEAQLLQRLANAAAPKAEESQPAPLKYFDFSGQPQAEPAAANNTQSSPATTSSSESQEAAAKNKRNTDLLLATVVVLCVCVVMAQAVISGTIDQAGLIAGFIALLSVFFYLVTQAKTFRQ